MNRQAFRPHRPDTGEGVHHIFGGFPGKAEDQIHINIGKSGLSGHVKGPFHIFNAMAPADNIQCPLVQRLGINGYPLNPMGLHHPEFIHIQAVRPAGFDGKFPDTV